LLVWSWWLSSQLVGEQPQYFRISAQMNSQTSAIRRQLVAAFLGTLAVALLSSCSTAPPSSQPSPPAPGASQETAGLEKIYVDLGKAGGKVYALNPKSSAIRIYVFRAGASARFGHNHVLSAPDFTGFVYVPDSGLSGARFDLEFRLDQLEVDNPAYRSNLGQAFSTPVPRDAAQATRENMLGENNLQAARFPWARIQSVQVAGEAPKLAAKVQVELHGQTREMDVPLTVEGLPQSISVSGSLVLRQSDFGVRTYSILGGALAVQDEIVIDFKLAGG
jgi:hypothetical protein